MRRLGEKANFTAMVLKLTVLSSGLHALTKRISQSYAESFFLGSRIYTTKGKYTETSRLLMFC